MQERNDMNFLELAAKRSSIRGYRPDPVEETALAQVLEAAHLAPSAANRQPLHIIVVRDSAARHDLCLAYNRDWLRPAPLLLAICTEPAKAWARADGKNYADVDGAILMDHITLCAADLGLGTCWIAAFDPAQVKSVLKLPEGIEPLALTPLGYPTDTGRPKIRKPLAMLVHHDHW
jgi:nitroreductase